MESNNQYIYSNDYYNSYTNLDNIIQQLENMKIDKQKKIIWQLFQIKSPSNVKWDSNIIYCKLHIEYIMMTLIHYHNWSHISHLDSNFPFIKHNIVNLLKTEISDYLEWENEDNNIIIAPILPLRDFNIVGIFILDNFNINKESEFYNENKKYNLLSNIGLNNRENIIKSAICNTNTNEYIEINIDGETLSTSKYTFLERICNYFPTFKINRQIIKTQNWKQIYKASEETKRMLAEHRKRKAVEMDS